MLNHREFMENAEESIQRNGLESLYSYVIYFDIIEFKMINHYYGAIQGDMLLKEIEEYLQTLPGVTLYERVFSDRYVILVSSPQNWTDEELIEKCYTNSEAFLSAQRKKFRACALEIACGIYRMTKGDSFREAVDGADLARKEAKEKKSREAVIFDRESVKDMVEYRVKEQGLYKALEEERFIFYLQPKVSLLTGEITGAEALARYVPMNESDCLEGCCMDEFMAIMERNGSAVNLDRLVLKKVCQYLAERKRAGLSVVRTSVNLSRFHIKDPEEPSKLHGIVQEYGISPELLEFELTERILMDDFAETKQFINKLRNYGYMVSIDDFGSGYAGINIWQELDFDTLKLDKIFLSEKEQHKVRNKAIVPNVINIAQRLNTEVICEGVENEEQCQYLLRLGCTVAQGYFFAKPAKPDEFYRVYEEISGYYKLPSENKRERGMAERTEDYIQTARARERAVRRTEYLWLVGNSALAVIYGAMELFLEKSWYSFLAIFGVTLVVGGILYRFFRKWLKEVYANEQRYAIMEQFSDTVLFTYDIKKDEIRFTPNVMDFFHCNRRVYAPFCKVVEESEDIFLGDREEILNAIYGNPQNQKKEIRIRLRHRENEEFFWCLVEFKYAYDEGKAVSIIGRMHNIDTQYRTEQVLMKQSSTDALTGLLNRAWTEDRIKEYIATEKGGTLLVVDVDDFKHVNDNYGHETGDRALCYVADSLKSICCSDDVVGRMGGDEFIIYLHECVDKEVVYEKMKCLRERLENAEQSFGVPLSVSVGASRYPMNGNDYRTLFRQADQAMYEAKNTGKNTCVFQEKTGGGKEVSLSYINE